MLVGILCRIAVSPEREVAVLAFYSHLRRDKSGSCVCVVVAAIVEVGATIVAILWSSLVVGAFLTGRRSCTPVENSSVLRADSPWSSGKFAVASVKDGLITAKKAGIADIKVKTSEGITGQCTVVVVPEKNYVPGMKSALKRAADAVVIAEIEFAK